jgi:small subunit ribosomal protein S19
MGIKIKNGFVHNAIIKNIEGFTIPGKNKTKKKNSIEIEVYSRSSIILPTFVGKTFKIYNGKKFLSLKVTEKIVG